MPRRKNPTGSPIALIGDVDPVENGGAIIYETPHGLMMHRIIPGEEGVSVYMFSIDDPKSDLDWVDDESVSDFTGEETTHLYREFHSGGAMGVRAALYIGAGDYHGYVNLDSDPLNLSYEKAEKLYGPDADRLASPERATNPSYEYDEWLEFFKDEDVSRVSDDAYEMGTEFEDGASEAVSALLEKYPGRDVPDEESIPYIVFATVQGHGVGIWDGKWDRIYPSASESDWHKYGEFLKKYKYEGKTLEDRGEDINLEISMEPMDYHTFKIPSWSVVYFVNGDSSHMTDEDQKQADKWMKHAQEKLKVTHFEYDRKKEGSYFSPSPDFGLAGDVVDVRGYIES